MMVIRPHLLSERGLSVLETRTDCFPGVGGVARLCHTKEVYPVFEAKMDKLYFVG